MNIKILCVGKIKEASIASAIQEYTKRISKYAVITITEVMDEPIPSNPSEKDIENIKKTEGDKMQKFIKPSDFVIALDLRGTELSSEEFADKIQDITLKGFSNICFLIGGSVGLEDNLVSMSNFVFSFSKLTFPHQLIRLFLTEQLFRSFKILNHEKYHW